MKKEFYTGQRFREDEDCEDFFPVEFNEEGYAAVFTNIKYSDSGLSMIEITLYNTESNHSPLSFRYHVKKGSTINICHDHALALTGTVTVEDIDNNCIVLSWDF